MDNKKLNEQESLELITQMIQNTKFKMVKNAGTPFLVWGYMTVVTSLLVWYLLKETGKEVTTVMYPHTKKGVPGVFHHLELCILYHLSDEF